MNVTVAISTERADCPACEAKRRHSDDEWKQFHPFAGQGFTHGQGWQGWSHPDLAAEAKSKVTAT